MQRNLFTMLAVPTLLCLCAPVLGAQTAPPAAAPAADAATPPVAEKSWALELGADYSSRYLFRGVSLLGDNGVIAPHARFGWGNLALYYYGYHGDIPGFEDKYAEADFGVDYTFAFGDKVSFTLGGVTYQYNHAAENDIGFLDTYEGYGIIAIDTLLAPTLSYYHDFDQVKGGYLSLAISHGFALGSKVSLDLSASAGFDFHYNNKDVSQGTFNDILIGADLPIQITDALLVHAMLQQSFSQRALSKHVDDDPSSKPFYGDHTIFTAGLSYTF